MLFKANRPGWSGMMQTIQKGIFLEKSSLYFLQMNDMDPNDLNCIYSTLCFVTSVTSESIKNNVVPVITFEHPLWWKYTIII